MGFQYDASMGSRIKKLREQRGLTQEQLAARLQIYGIDLSRSTYAKIEIGQRHIYSWEIKAFKEILKVSYDDLFV